MPHDVELNTRVTIMVSEFEVVPPEVAPPEVVPPEVVPPEVVPPEVVPELLHKPIEHVHPR